VSVTAPAGFRAAGVTAGLKPSGTPDVALVVNDGPGHDAAAVFTSNRCKANPVLWSEQAIVDGRARAVLLNSGGANCYTGAQGFQTTHASAERAAEALGIGAIDLLVCSTGLIGEQLDRDRVLAGVDAVVPALETGTGLDAATAIMTTDTVPKQATAERAGFRVGGMAKGAGMLAPGLATMLVVLTTDAQVAAPELDAALRGATGATFDRLDTDGCMSTNDTVALLASGASGVGPDPAVLNDAVGQVCQDLAAQLWRDAEGAAHDIAVQVVSAADESDAVTAGRSIARSNLFKAAMFGQDPNWGRVLAAIGTTDAAFEPHEVDVTINGVAVCRGGEPAESRDLVDLSGREVRVVVDLHAGTQTATILTSDLTYDYVHENAAYST